jgi:hypothetical protein
VKQEATTMALGKHLDEQQAMWVATTSLPKSPGHVFYRKLNELLAEADFDRTVEKLCRPYYHSHIGRPGIPPGVYFRMLLVGYFEGIGSQEIMAADKVTLRMNAVEPMISVDDPLAVLVLIPASRNAPGTRCYLVRRP